jgi:hypothetical protein
MKTISMKALAAALGIFALTLTIGCKKDDDVVQPDKIGMLTSGTWALSGMTVNPAIDWFGEPTTDILAKLPGCLKDDLTIFKANGTITYDEGASKCDPADPQTTQGTWTVNANQTVLTIVADGETTPYDISTLTNDQFKAEYEVEEEGINYTFTVTFSKK